MIDLDRPAGEAMRLLDKIMAEKPEKNGHDFSAAVRCLVMLRDALAAEHGARERLDSVNAIISSVLGGQYPMEAMPWPSVDAARQRLAVIVRELASQEGRA
jgi:formate dehydrogenase major subunit